MYIYFIEASFYLQNRIELSTNYYDIFFYLSFLLYLSLIFTDLLLIMNIIY